MSKYPLELAENEKILGEFRGSYSWISFVLSIILAKIPLCFFVFFVIGLVLYSNKIIITNEKIFIKNLFLKEIVTISEISKITYQNHLIVIFFREKKETFLYKNPEEFIKIFQENFSKIPTQKTKDNKNFFGKISESKEKINKNIIQPAKKAKKETHKNTKHDPFSLDFPDGFDFPAKNPYKGSWQNIEVKDFDNEPHCPYCDILLAKIPSRKTKCKNCEKFYFYNNFPYENKKILTEEENEKAKKANNELYSSYRFLDEISDYTEKNFYKIFDEKYRNGENFLKIISGICDEIIGDLEKGKYFYSASNILCKKALFWQENGGNWHEILKASNIYRLRHYLELGYQEVEIMEGDSRKKSRITDEIRNPTLPHKNCKHTEKENWCACSYFEIS